MFHVRADSYDRPDGERMLWVAPDCYVSERYIYRLDRVAETEHKPRRRHRKRQRTRRPVPPLANRGEARLHKKFRAKAEPLWIPRLSLPGRQLCRVNGMFERKQISGREHRAAIRF